MGGSHSSYHHNDSVFDLSFQTIYLGNNQGISAMPPVFIFFKPKTNKK
jgi:hypothetical protein